MDSTTLLSTAYLPPIEYIACLIRGTAWVDTRERYHKQSYRNRACILTGNGVQTLTVPVEHRTGPTPIRDAHIDYKMPWQRTHWRTIVSAYGNSPYLLYYLDALKPFYEKHFEFLFDYNMQLTDTILRMMRIPADLHLTDENTPPTTCDLREVIHPKNASQPDYPFRLRNKYYQVFEDRYGFVPNLSILDLLFNTGPDALSYMKAQTDPYTSC